MSQAGDADAQEPAFEGGGGEAAPLELELDQVAVHETAWQPSDCRATLHVTLDACILPDSHGSARVDVANLVVLDNFFGEAERTELLDFVTQPGWDHTGAPPSAKWERSTRDRVDAAPTWGLQDEWLRRLGRSSLRAKIEIQSRLAKLYPDYMICHMPSDLIQQRPVHERASGPGGEPHVLAAQHDNGEEHAQPTASSGRGRREGGSTPPAADDEDQSVDCNCFVANAAVHGDTYGWHQDADPAELPYPSPWTRAFGLHGNREPGKPLFVSLLLYLNGGVWERQWDAETLFLDTPSDCGIVVRPKAYRAVLLDQDILHRLSMPSAAAGGRPRYSLVWKLVFMPTKADQKMALARPAAWGRPTPFGSAAALEQVVAALAAGGGGGAAGGRAGGVKRQREAAVAAAQEAAAGQSEGGAR